MKAVGFEYPAFLVEEYVRSLTREQLLKTMERWAYALENFYGPDSYFRKKYGRYGMITIGNAYVTAYKELQNRT